MLVFFALANAKQNGFPAVAFHHSLVFAVTLENMKVDECFCFTIQCDKTHRSCLRVSFNLTGKRTTYSKEIHYVMQKKTDGII